MVQYKFKEGALIEELKAYIDSTYDGHYSGGVQPTELIMSGGHGVGFCVGNIIKYAHRYGKKEGTNRKDIQKILHYSLMLLFAHDTDSDQK